MTVAKTDPFDKEALNEIEPFTNPKPMEVLSDQALQKVQTAYTTAVAVQQPRRIERIAANVIAEAKLAGEDFFYGWDVKNKRTGKVTRIEGPSIDLAMSLARNYGNCVLDVEATETPTHYMFKGVFIDLETGFTCPRLFRQRKGQDIGSGYGDDRAEDMVFQIGQSKSIRNAIIRAMPAWLIKQAIYVAKRAEVEKIKPDNLPATRAAVIEFFGRYSVTPDMLVAYLDGKEESRWDAEDIVNLKGVMSGINEGRITAREVFMADEKAKDLEDALTKEETPESPPNGDSTPDETKGQGEEEGAGPATSQNAGSGDTGGSEEPKSTLVMCDDPTWKRLKEILKEADADLTKALKKHFPDQKPTKKALSLAQANWLIHTIEVFIADREKILADAKLAGTGNEPQDEDAGIYEVPNWVSETVRESDGQFSGVPHLLFEFLQRFEKDETVALTQEQVDKFCANLETVEMINTVLNNPPMGKDEMIKVLNPNPTDGSKSLF